jgi:hypothetical protein
MTYVLGVKKASRLVVAFTRAAAAEHFALAMDFAAEVDSFAA